MPTIDPRFGLIPLPISEQMRAVPYEFMTQSSTGHIFIKQADGTVVSKTVDLEERMIELENRRKATETHVTLTGDLLTKSLILPAGVLASTQANGSVRLTGATSLTASQIGFVSKYCGFLYSAMESYVIGLDVDGIVSEMTMISQSGKKIKSELANNSVSKVNVKLSSVVFSDDDASIKEVSPVIVCNFSGGAITIRSLIVNKMDTNLYNCIDYGSSLHIDYRYAKSHLLVQNGIVSGKGGIIDTECFKIYKTGVTHIGYLKIFLPNNIVRQGSYALQLVMRNKAARMLDIDFNPAGITNNFRVNTTTYTPNINGRILVNLKFEWDNDFDATKDTPYVMISCGNEDIALIESVHIVRIYPAKYSDNSLWAK